jgi:hypothetical protein
MPLPMGSLQVAVASFVSRERGSAKASPSYSLDEAYQVSVVGMQRALA